MLTPSLRDFHEMALDRYKEIFENISTGEYATTFSAEDVDIDALDERASLDVFYRCFPYTGQDTMMVSINPGIVSSIKSGSEGAMHAAVGPDFDAKATISMHYILLYHLGMQTDSDIRTPRLFSRLAAESSSDRFTDADATDEYFQLNAAAEWEEAAREINPDDFEDWLSKNSEDQVDPSKGFLSEVYYSVAYKLATENASSVNEKLTRELLPKEIGIVDPSLIITCGALPWDTLYAEYGDILTPAQGGNVPSNVSEAAGTVFKSKIAGDIRYIAVLQHMSVMKHENQDRIAEVLAREGIM
jgi:hypothetical protein